MADMSKSCMVADRSATSRTSPLAEQIATLLDASERFDADRLHQEAILMASKDDVREELDRLTAHVAQGDQDDPRRRRGWPPSRFPGAGAQP
jgi:uncharacterized protein YicC (UPF0701 family)